MAICKFSPTSRKRARDGLPIWECPECRAKVAVEIPPRGVICRADGEPTVIDQPPAILTVDDLGCPWRLRDTGKTVACGCGATTRRVPVYRCARYGFCTLQATNRRVKIDGAAVRACVACLAASQMAAAASPPPAQ